MLAESDPEEPTPAATLRTVRYGRRIALALFGLGVVVFALSAIVQITQQVFFAPETASAYPDCPSGLRALYRSINDGKASIQRVGAVPPADDEALLRDFRRSLQPVWKHRDAIAHSCKADAKLLGVLDSIERLRYSEEHGVRHQAAELFAIRARARKLVAKHLGL